MGNQGVQQQRLERARHASDHAALARDEQGRLVQQAAKVEAKAIATAGRLQKKSDADAALAQQRREEEARAKETEYDRRAAEACRAA